MIKDYFRLAYRSARHRKIRSWLTMIGIFIGIAAVVSLISLSEGLKVAIEDQFVGLGTDKIIVQAAGGGFGPPGTGVPVRLTKEDEKVIEKTRGIERAVGRLIRTVEVRRDKEIRYAFAVTVTEDPEELDLIISANDYQIDQGKFLDKEDAAEIVIGSGYAADLFDEPLELRDKVLLEGKEFKIVGILKKSGNPQKDSSIVIPDQSLRNILGLGDEFDIIPAQVQAGLSVDTVSEDVKKELRKSRDVDEGKEDFTVQTPQQVIGTLNSILAIVQGVLVGIAAISLLVGGIGIMNTMYTAVLERTKEIGIMKAIGAENKTILLLFLIESGFLGFFGGLIGVTLGASFSKAVELIAFQIFESPLIKASFPPVLLIGALLFAFVVGAVSGAFPAKQAAKLKPVDALRK